MFTQALANLSNSRMRRSSIRRRRQRFPRLAASVVFGPWWGNMRPMNQATLIEVLRNYDAALRETGATGLFVFGSRAVGTQRPDSNLDLFIDYDAATKIPNMFCLMQIEDEISEALGIPVTITTRNALHPLMKESIEQDAIRVS
jgi:uncharacterized protein